jgi:nucleotidyltransferase substrate binding protein (TIGR01987 family)
MTTSEDIFYPHRWQQRFQNFQRAFLLLQEPFSQKAITDFSPLEQEGIIQRFEFCYELAWKTLKDYLEYDGVVVDPVTPRQVIKQAFAANLITEGQVWIDMLEHRNLLSHTYDSAVFLTTLSLLQARFLPAINQVYHLLREKIAA